jgi:hypothetical protein
VITLELRRLPPAVLHASIVGRVDRSVDEDSGCRPVLENVGRVLFDPAWSEVP